LPLEVATPAAQAAIEGRCPTVSVAAPNAEAVHDYIDEILEKAGAYDVSTDFLSGPDAVQELIGLFDTGMVSNGRVFVYSDDPELVERELRLSGLLGS